MEYRAVGALLTVLLGFGAASMLAVPPATAPNDSTESLPKPNTPKIAPASDEAERAIPGFKAAPGLKIELFAAEPLLANPVAFAIDEQNRFYIAESFRQEKGVEDNRGHGNWLETDIASRTHEDRVAMFKKFFGANYLNLSREEDRITRLEDSDGDGKADKVTVFAGGFNDPMDGTGAGLLVRRSHVWYTCIPHLWLLEDKDNDGVADARARLSSGYGVHVALRGHDFHGLCFGPDGKLYSSIGDRGLNVVTKEGRKLENIDTGAVLRCDPDGSNLEIFATGLRNPQELAFDQYGNLFTGDNNSDGGDRARWVHVVEGGDTGWRMSFQYINDRGVWNREKLWQPHHPGQPAWHIPPIANIADGPSGLVYNPGGTALPDRYKEHFFLADFRGGASNSLVHSLAVKPKGAGFALDDHKDFVKGVLATDVEFSPDGSLYIADWVESWGGVGKGRVYRVNDPAIARGPQLAEIRTLLSEGVEKKTSAELTALLGHVDMRIRQAAQFALASRAAVDELSGVATAVAQGTLARIHAIWGLGQVGRKQPGALTALPALLGDRDVEVRAQAAKTLGDLKVAAAGDKLVPLLKDESARVRYFAALSLGKLHHRAALDPLLALARDNADKDPVLRHAAVFGLAGVGDPNDLVGKATDPSPSARMAILLALRRLQHPELARFLQDDAPPVAAEAVRAINDVPIDAAMPALAATIGQKQFKDENLLWRIVNANYRVGKAENAKALASFATDSQAPEASRAEALSALNDWGKASNQDRVLGLYRPLPARSADAAIAAITPVLPRLFSEGPSIVAQAAARLAGEHQIKSAGAALLELAAKPKGDVNARIEAIKALAKLKDPRLVDAARRAASDTDPKIRKEGLTALAGVDPTTAVKAMATVLARGTVIEQQGVLKSLALMRTTQADALLAEWMDKLIATQTPLELQLDLLEAARTREQGPVKEKVARYEASLRKDDPLAPYREALAGGNADQGRKIFFEKAEASCLRCHKADGEGGDVGPDLSRIGAERNRENLLESLVDPNRQISPGYQTVTLTLADHFYTGRLVSEDGESVKLETTDDAGERKQITVLKNQIKSQNGEMSPMPENLKEFLSKAELRDLIEYLATRK